MSTQIVCVFFIVLISAQMLSLSYADVGTAAHYSPPYLPTACGGKDTSLFPTSYMFGAAGEGVWDNGAACGRLYQLRCISAVVPGTCKRDNIIFVKIVDRAFTAPSRPSTPSTTLLLSTTAFAAIANLSAPYVNIEFQSV